MQPDFRIPPDVSRRAAQVTLLIVDVDGVLTDGTISLSDDETQTKGFHSRDGLGLKLARRNGVETAIITARESRTVAHRARELGIDYLYQGCTDKLAAYRELAADGRVDEQVAYVGDDLVDLPVMTRVGLAVAVADAHVAVRHHAHWTTPLPGGRGAVRQVCDLLLVAKGVYQQVIDSYLPPS